MPGGEAAGGVDLCPCGAEARAARAAQEQARWRPGERVYTVTRAGCPGIQSYAQTWSGDNTTSWASLRFGLRTGLNMGLSGMFNVGHDVGGFAGPSPDGELLARWLQAGALHPRFVMNSWKADGAVTTPWMHPAVTPHARWAMRLRLRLMPLLYSLYVARPRPAAPARWRPRPAWPPGGDHRGLPLSRARQLCAPGAWCRRGGVSVAHSPSLMRDSLGDVGVGHIPYCYPTLGV